jgi:hypothetical protein
LRVHLRPKKEKMENMTAARGEVELRAARVPDLLPARGEKEKQASLANRNVMHPSPRKPNLTADQYAARFKAERARQVRRYCDAFELWRRCMTRLCRRNNACRGDAHACLACAIDVVPHAIQWRTRQDMLAAMPQNIGAPERAARLCMPRDFCTETTAQAVADYLARFKPKSPRLAR